jgi:hypothetical protein
VKVLLKTKGHESFLGNSGKWTADMMEAQDFKSFLAVLDYRREHKVPDVEAYFAFDDAKYNFVLKIN